MKTMLECFHTTSTDALTNETSLLPPCFCLQKKVLNSVIQMLNLPLQYPLHEWIHRAGQLKWQKLSFPTNLVNITKHFPESMHDLETIVPYICLP